jgi:hypothetical protein
MKISKIDERLEVIAFSLLNLQIIQEQLYPTSYNTADNYVLFFLL